MERNKLVRFLVDSYDEDLKVGVCTEGVVEKVEMGEDGIWLWRWCATNNENMMYIIPYSEENKMFMFID